MLEFTGPVHDCCPLQRKDDSCRTAKPTPWQISINGGGVVKKIIKKLLIIPNRTFCTYSQHRYRVSEFLFIIRCSDIWSENESCACTIILSN